MRYYAKAHRAILAVIASSALGGLAWWLSGTVLPMPQLLQGRATPVETQLLLATIVAPITVAMFNQSVLSFEQLSERRLWRYDLLLIAALIAPICLISLTVLLRGEPELAAALLRNTVVFAGLALFCLGWLGEVAALAVPISYFLIIGMLGVRPDGSSHLWAFPRGPVGLYDLIAAIVILAVGLTVFWLRQRQAPAGRFS